MSNDLIVIDISHYQTILSFDDVLDAGVVGVIIKASEATSADPEYSSHRDGAEAAGLAVSTYHFLRHGNIAQQMDFYLSKVKPEPGERMCLDWEDAKVTLDEVKQAIEILLGKDLGLQVTIYASASFLQEHVPDQPDATLAATSLWVARYSSQAPYFPKAVWPAWSLWQFTDKGNVAGIGSLVDGNRFNGSTEQCLKWFGPATEPEPAPAPEPDDDEPEIVVSTVVRGRNATVDVTTTDDMNVKVLVNGDPR